MRSSPKNQRTIMMASSYDDHNVTAIRQRTGPASPSNEPRVSRAPLNDAELVARCRAGDVDAFEELYRQHSPRVFSLACRMTGSPQEGEDLLQEIFLLVHRKLDSFRGDSALGTWLYRLAVDLCLDFIRGRQNRIKSLSDAFE